MNIVYAVLVLGILGAIFGLVLAIASKVFEVKTDPRLPEIIEALPGANCGGCGFAGCSDCASNILAGRALSMPAPWAAPTLHPRSRRSWA